jgi:hypothetical protein
MVGFQYNGEYGSVQMCEKAQGCNVDHQAMKMASLKVLFTKEVPACKELISVLNEMINFT